MTATDDRPQLAQVPYPRGIERQQRATFDEPGAADIRAGVDVAQDAERGDLIEDQALAELEQMTERGRAGMAAQGRHVSDRLADEQRWRRDLIDTGDAVSEASRGMAARHQALDRAQRARDAMNRPRGDDFVGVGQLSDAGYRRWVEHCAAGWGGPTHLLLDPDDLDMDAARDHGYGIDADDVHYRSPDLDDLDDSEGMSA